MLINSCNLSKKEKKELILSWFYYTSAFLCIGIPIIDQYIDLHSKLNSFLIYLLSSINLEPFSHLNINGYVWQIKGNEIWDFYAIILTLIFSILLLWEPEEREGIRVITLTLGFGVLFVCGLGILFLGLHLLLLYHISLFITICFLTFVDSKMYFNSVKDHQASVISNKAIVPIEKVYRRIEFFVDYPILITLLLLTSYTGFLTNKSLIGSSPLESKLDFFSGAIAFQFIIGNLLIMFFRNYDDIMQDTESYAPKKIIFIVFYPIGKTYSLLRNSNVLPLNLAVGENKVTNESEITPNTENIEKAEES